MRMLPIVVVVSAARAAIIATAPASRVATPPLERIREGVATTIESGSRIWDSGRALHAYLATDASLVGRSVVELGSGTGIGGLGAAASGAHVVLSDLPEQLPLIRSNIISCGLEADAVRDAARAAHRHACPLIPPRTTARRVSPHARVPQLPLTWGDASDAARVRRRAETRDGAVDLIVGSDLLYAPERRAEIPPRSGLSSPRSGPA